MGVVPSLVNSHLIKPVNNDIAIEDYVQMRLSTQK
jgi:hypothetical protein